VRVTTERRTGGGTASVDTAPWRAPHAEPAALQVVATLPDVLAALSGVAAQCRTELLLCDQRCCLEGDVAQPYAFLELWHRVVESLLRRGIAVRRLLTAPDVDPDEEQATGARLVGHGLQTRVVDRPLPQLLLVDRRLALLALDGRKLADGGVLMRDPATVRALGAAYGALWESASPAAASHGVPVELRAVLAMLLRGVTDDVAARRLGVSPRTYHRRVARLLHVLGAGSRFQAGAVAAERGWVRPRSTP
jgi:hypothetical protein